MRIITMIRITICIGENMKENYVYPAVFTKTEQGNIEITFLDFPEIIAEASSTDEALKTAQEALAISILGYLEEKRELPEASFLTEGVIYIQVWMPFFKNMAKEVYVRKSVTIPEWLDILAKKNSVNYSAALVKGIKSELGIEN